MSDRRRKERRKRDVPPCACRHYPSQHQHVWDGEAGKFFWFCHGCDKDGKKYPETHHQPKAGTMTHDGSAGRSPQRAQEDE
jgi:hypothetical protein